MEKLAKMAMLSVADANRLWSDIEKMLAMAEDLNDVEIINAHNSMTGELRSDEACGECAMGGYIVVPKVVGK